jgi:signal peptidase I
METKLFFISIGLLIYTVILRRFVLREKLNKYAGIALHVVFCCLVGIVAGLIFATLTNKTEMSLTFAFACAVVGAALGFLQAFGKDVSVMQSKVLKVDLDWADTSWSAVLLASLLMFFVIQAFKIPSGSMRQTLLEGDHLFVNKFIYGFHIPFSGGRTILPLKKINHRDIIVFRCPQEALSAEEQNKGIKKDFIKRAIGLPGDIIEIKDKALYVNGEKSDEPYANYMDNYVQPKVRLFDKQEEYQLSWEKGKFVTMPIRDNFGPVKVPEGYYMVMGDNRDMSFDSRFWGPLPSKLIKGRAWVVYWPPKRIKIIK